MLWFYRLFLYPLLLVGFRVLSFFNDKVRAGWAMRTTARAPTKAVGGIWIHCASGEFEYAKPVIVELKRRYPNCKVGVTYFSPSVVQNIANFKSIDEALPNPWDTPHHVRAFLDAAQPRLFLIARTDLWPEMLYQCRKRKIPTILFSATLTAQSGRMHWLARHFYAWVTSQLSWVACVSSQDQLIFHQLAPHTHCDVLGDTRFDQVLARLQHPKALKNDLKPTTDLTLIAGSTWPEDEAVLIPAFVHLLQEQPDLRILLAPHEPSAEHLAHIEAQLTHLNLKSARYSQAQPQGWQVLVIDQVGILAELYTWGQIAFVGGSFRKTVHSVMEPLAAGCLTLLGPYHHNNREALAFAQQPLSGFAEQGAMVQVFHRSDDLVQICRRWQRLQKWPEISLQIRAGVTQHAQSSARLVDELHKFTQLDERAP